MLSLVFPRLIFFYSIYSFLKKKYYYTTRKDMEVKVTKND